MNDARIRLGFVAAAAFNIGGILVFTRALTNQAIFATDPAMFSRPACLLVMVWGLAYAAQARSWRAAPAISAVFALEKFIYAAWWCVWLAHRGGELAALAERDLPAGVFYAVYGAGDAAFGLFFAWAAWRARRPAAA
ncbi:MAG: hypothetical protein HZA54_03265 [Planctomycetes bacterium]|nr:hypothetical protein [Planctomycetota bacterium]